MQIAHRGFIVWAAAIVLILGVFMIFVGVGWPGEANECIDPTDDASDSCFCETFSRSDVTSHASGVRQPVNTWSNLYAVLTSLLVALVIFRDRKSSATPANLMKSKTAMPDTFIFAILFLGLGSMWFHASLTTWGGYLDGMSMYVFTAFLVFYSIRRMWDSALFFWIGYPATVILFTALHNTIPSVINIAIIVLAYIIVECIIWYRTKTFLQGRWQTILLWFLALLAMGLATLFWALSQTGAPLCDPNSGFQPHGLLWHPLAGVMAVLLYFYWRAADDPV